MTLLGRICWEASEEAASKSAFVVPLCRHDTTLHPQQWLGLGELQVASHGKEVSRDEEEEEEELSTECLNSLILT